jgi:hypothetical protein
LITTNWEEGTRCAACTEVIGIGEEVLYGRHLACARAQARARDSLPDGDVLLLARQRLQVPGHLTLTARQLRALVERARRAGVIPVCRPDRRRGTAWYARLPGWSAERVEAGLSAAEVAGLWLDFLAVGRMPPLRHADLETLLDAAEAADGARKT